MNKVESAVKDWKFSAISTHFDSVDSSEGFLEPLKPIYKHKRNKFHCLHHLLRHSPLPWNLKILKKNVSVNVQSTVKHRHFQPSISSMLKKKIGVFHVCRISMQSRICINSRHDGAEMLSQNLSLMKQLKNSKLFFNWIFSITFLIYESLN